MLLELDFTFAMLFDPMFLTVGYLLKVKYKIRFTYESLMRAILSTFVVRKKCIVKYLDFPRRSFINSIVHDTNLQTYFVTHMHKVSILQIVFSQPLHRLVKCPLVSSQQTPSQPLLYRFYWSLM